MGKLYGKVAVITGGGRGIGRAIAEGFVREGARVVVTAPQEHSEIESFAAKWSLDRALALKADVTDPDACEIVIAETISRFGQIDVLVNNAGRGMRYVSEHFLTEPTRFWEVDPTVWRMVIATNVNGPFFMTSKAVPHRLRHGSGAIINISMNYETMKRRGKGRCQEKAPGMPLHESIELNDGFPKTPNLNKPSLRFSPLRFINPPQLHAIALAVMPAGRAGPPPGQNLADTNRGKDLDPPPVCSR